jgi:hypothetical protein
MFAQIFAKITVYFFLRKYGDIISQEFSLKCAVIFAKIRADIIFEKIFAKICSHFLENEISCNFENITEMKTFIFVSTLDAILNRE